MNRRTLYTGGLFALALGAMAVGLVLFKVRVAVAGGKYMLLLAVIVLVVWGLSRGMRK